MAAALPPAQDDDLVGHADPVEPSDFDLLADNERREWARDTVLEHGEEGPVLLILPVGVDERLLDEAAQLGRT